MAARPARAGDAGFTPGDAGFTPGSAGFTLVEVIVSLALFALIASAGAALVTTVLDAQRHTAGRIDRVADIARTLAVIGRDLDDIADGPLTGSVGGVAFARHAARGAAPVAYRVAGRRLERVAGGAPQRLLDGVAAARWHYLAAPGGWQDHWPPDAAAATVWPAAVAVDLDLAGPPPHGRVRRVVDLPARPLPVSLPAASP